VSSVEFGVFGGSFDPPHIAHTLLVSCALSAYGLERVLVIPAYAHAFGKQSSSFEDRLRMCELAFGELPRVEVCDVERDLPAPSYMVNTLAALEQRFPAVQLRLLIGADIVTETHAWHDFARIARVAPPIVFERQGAPSHDASQPALPHVSSSEIRRRLRTGESTRGWLSPSVAQYARARALYRDP
jgi:nicotinate-nucleotide adenylyltransferase